MLGWMLKRGDAAADANRADDTIVGDQPDTPAPIFAARALRRAVFGTPMEAVATAARVADGSDTPSKPQGILLTPGTGASKRKRVSFGQQIPRSKLGSEITKARTTEESKKARLLGNAKGNARKTSAPPSKRVATTIDSDSDWEEDDDDDGDGASNPDMTLDLNEPHSQSGRFWKEEFHKYQQEAKAEMDKLLQFKQLAKSYAQQKDSEAIQLTELLKTAQEKVVKLEKSIADDASRMLFSPQSKEDNEDLRQKLTRQTALAIQYRERVQEFREKLREKEAQDAIAKDIKSKLSSSPRTQITLLETQRELRRAKAQAQEAEDLRREVKSLKMQLRQAQEQAEEAQAPVGDSGIKYRSQIRELRDELLSAKEETREKGQELRLLKAEFDRFKRDAANQEEDMKTVLDRAHSKIAELKKEARASKAKSTASSRHSSRQSENANKPAATKEFDGPLEKFSSRSIAKHDDLTVEPKRARIKVDDDDNQDDMFDFPSTRRSYLRQQQQEDRALLPRTTQKLGKPDIGQPQWQAFVPRSPRNRAYLGERLEGKIENGGVTPIALRAREDAKLDLVALAKAATRPSAAEVKAEDDDSEFDLLKARFARLNNSSSRKKSSTVASSRTTTSKRSLSADQRAAQLAKIEERMAKRKMNQTQLELNKENIRP